MKWVVRSVVFLLGMMLAGEVLAQSSPMVPLVPTRLLDTRPGHATVDGQNAGTGPVASPSRFDLTVLGRGGIPASGVSAVAVNITVTDPTGSGYVVAWPADATMPNASNLNYVAGLSISNEVIVKVSTTGATSGKIAIFVFAGTGGSANVIADVTGYFPTTSDLNPLTPARLLDTRAGMTTIDGQFAGGGAVTAGGTLNLTVLGRGGVPASGVKAVVVNVTATGATASTFITAWPNGASRPNASNLNVFVGQTIANLVMVAPDPTTGKISLFNSAGSTDLIVDVVGYFTSTPTFAPLVPARLLDTRPGQSTVDGQSAGQGAVASGGTYTLNVLGRGGVPSTGVGAVALNVTAVVPTTAGYITAWGTGTTTNNTPPQAMVINFTAGSVVPSLVIVQVGPGNGQVSLYNSNGSTHLIADVVGWFPSASGPPLPPSSVSVSSNSGSNALTASWTLAVGGAPPTYLKIQRATNLAGPWTLVNGNYTPAISGQLADLVFANATYYYEVAACNTAGCSAYTVSNGAALSSIPAAPTSDAPVIASIPATDPISDSVGATAAQFRVDEGGNATYSVPIQVPPGTAGVAPKLALSYNSRLPNGLAGPGWTIEGSSQISRCRQTRESGDFGQADGNPPPVNFTATDRFCLDGVRLLLLSGNTGAYGANATTYSPETDPTTMVTVYVSGTYVGPDSFTVQRKDGTTSTYGYAASSPNALVTAPNPANIQTTTTVSWNLARVQDSKGNYIDYLYNSRPASGSLPFTATAVETTLMQVKYTGHATSPVSNPYASINFTYAPLPTNLIRIGYQGGVTFVQTQQLSCVTVTSGTTSPSSCTDTAIVGSTLRYYGLTYQSSASGSQFQQLSQIQECRDNSKAVCFGPTTFNWSAAQNTLQLGTQYQTQSSPNFGGNGVGNASSLAGYKLADVDGDGRLDFVWAVNEGTCPNGGSSIYVGFLDRTATGEMTLTTNGQGKTCAPINLQDNDRAWYLLDYDGDGRADLLIGGAAGSNWAIYSSAGRPASAGATVFGSTNLLAGLATPITVPAGTNAVGVLADMNGDGLPDFIIPAYAGTLNPTETINNQADSGLVARYLVRQTNGTLQFSDPYPVILTFAAGDSICKVSSQVQCSINFFNTNARNGSAITTDLNGDGRADLTFILETVPCGTPQMPVCPAAAVQGLPRLTFNPRLGMPKGGQSSTNAAPLVNQSTYYWYQFVADGIGSSQIYSQPVQLMKEYAGRLNTSSAPYLPIDIKKIYFADMNGDGLADLLYQDTTTSTTYHLMVNTGNGYQAPIDVTNISNGSLLQLVDINGDGKTDLVYPSGSSPFSTYNYQSLVPNSAAANGWGFMTSPGTVPGGGLYGYADWISLIGDFDGDGAPDYLGLSPTAPNGTGNMYTSRAAAGSRYQPRDVITDFINGFGATTHVAYQPLTNIGVYQRGGTNGYPALTGSTDYGWGSPVFDVLAPMYVVSQASSSAPTQADANAMSTVYYRYAGALMQAGGRGFLGFYDIWNFDANDSASVGNQYVAVLNRYAQRFPITGMPIATLKQALSGGMTRGSAWLDACAANPETLSYNCFSGITGSSSAPTFQVSWPSIAGTWFSFGYQTPICAGPGCQVTVSSTACTLGGNNSVQLATRPTDYTAGVFTGSATPGPVFSYVSYTQDTTFDLATSTSANHVANAEVENWFCYDGNGSTAGYGNLAGSRTKTSDGAVSPTTAAEKIVANTYTDNVAAWQLGRLTQSTVSFARPAQTTRTRTTSFTYEAGSGMLNSEHIQAGGSADQDLRTLYDLDAWGNRTAAYQCSADLTDAQCRAHSGANQQQSGTTVLRYAKTSYDSIGRYSTGSSLPFYGAGGAWNELQAMSIGKRDEFGNAVQQKSINDTYGYTLNSIATTQWSQYGVLGRPYFAGDVTGKSSTTTYRLCSGANGIPCSADTRLKFRSQTVTAGAPSSWTYYDVLGRPVLQIARSFDGNNSTNQQYSAVCMYTDAHNRVVYQSEPFFLPVPVYSDGSPLVLPNTTPLCANAQYATTTVYDVLGRVVRLNQPDGNAINKTYVGLTTTTSSPRNAAWIWSQSTNVLGEVVSTQDPQATGDVNVGLTVTQTFDAMGDVLTITRNAGSGNIVTSASYDDLGRKTSQTDPDSGATTFSYNAAGEVISQTDAKLGADGLYHQTITLSYDAQGRRWQRATSNAADGNNLTDTWTYDQSANGYGQLASESRSATSTSATPFARRVAYDNRGRLVTRTTTIAGKDYPETSAYDGYGRAKAQTDISGYYVSPSYTANGYTSTLSDTRVGTVYQLLTTTARGQVASDQRGGSTALQSALTYYADTGRLNTVCSGASCNLQDLSYHFDAAGNLDARTRAVSSASTSESFTYDALNRLKSAGLVKINGVTPTTIPTLGLAYDKLGNLCTKTPLSGGTVTYQYAGPAGCASHGSLGSPHAAVFVGGVAYGYDANGNQTTNGNGRAISYNALNQVTQSVENGVTVTFEYGPDGDRFKRTDSDEGATLYYVGSTEIRVASGQLNLRRYLAGGKAIDYVRSASANETRYVFMDHLGSTDVTTNLAGQILDSQSFDAHGNQRDPVTWQNAVPATSHIGFTGQEHVNSQGFIHFNGRIYDASIGKMLQADPLTGPGTQGLNRYAYVANNPLTLTDPTGYSFWNSFLGNVIHVALDVIAYAYQQYWLAAAIDAVWAYGATNGNLTAAAGAFLTSYATSVYLGPSGGWDEFVKNPTGFLISQAGRSLAQGVMQGTLAALQGQSFGGAFRSAAISSFASSFGPSGNSSTAGVMRAIIGGTTSALSGGKFANGAATALAAWAAESAVEKYQAGNDQNKYGVGGDGTPVRNIAVDPNGNQVAGNDTAGHATDSAGQVTSSPYGTPRGVNSQGEYTAHSGIDIVPTNSDGTVNGNAHILSISGGTVDSVGYVPGFGDHTVVVRLDDGNYITYGHMSAAGVIRGQQISVGTDLGTVGTQGMSTGIHVHIQETIGAPFFNSPGFRGYVNPGSH